MRRYAAVVISPRNGSDPQLWNLNDQQLQNVAFTNGCLINPAGASMFAHLWLCIGMWDQNWYFDSNGQVTTDPGWLCLAVLGGPGQGWDLVS